MSKLSPRRSIRLLRSHCREIDRPKAGTVMFGVPELLAQILGHCSWASRVNLSHTSVHARLVVQALIRRRIRYVLKPFVEDISAFFSLIRAIKAVIVGSAAWNVMTVDDVGPRDINIVVPAGSVYAVERLKDFFSAAGTTITFDGLPGIVYENCASRFIKLMQKSGSTVTITLANQPSVIPVVISSPYTCQFNIMTATHLYSLYPKMLSCRETVRGMAPTYVAETQRLALRGVRVVRPNAEWTVPCGEVCLPVWRRTEVLDGAGIIRWGGYDADQNCEHVGTPSLTDDIGFSDYKWRLGVHCTNTACPSNTNATLI